MLAINIADGLPSRGTIEIWVLQIGDRAINQELPLEGQRSAPYFNPGSPKKTFLKDFSSLQSKK